MTKTTIKTEEVAATVPVTIKNFKNSDEVENFYRFIHENKLRAEAQKIVEVVLRTIAPPPKRRGRKKNIQ
jgi:hypothetical protein